MMKPKINREGEEGKSNVYDRCQTPSYALPPLLKYAPNGIGIWEPACGEGNIARTLEHYGFQVSATDLLTGTDFYKSHVHSDCLITNPPYSIKYSWIERCYELGDPFALLIPAETIGAARAQRCFEKHGVEIIYLDKRINFKMPSHRTWEETLKPTPVRDDNGEVVYVSKNGKQTPKMTSGAQFPVAWFTHGLNIGKEITFEKIDRCLQSWEKLVEQTV